MHTHTHTELLRGFTWSFVFLQHHTVTSVTHAYSNPNTLLFSFIGEILSQP